MVTSVPACAQSIRQESDEGQLLDHAQLQRPHAAKFLVGVRHTAAVLHRAVEEASVDFFALLHLLGVRVIGSRHPQIACLHC